MQLQINAGMACPVHSSLTAERVAEASRRQMMSLDNPGFCVSCGAEQDGCEPDAERYACEVCGQRAVYGAEQLLILLVA